MRYKPGDARGAAPLEPSECDLAARADAARAADATASGAGSGARSQQGTRVCAQDELNRRLADANAAHAAAEARIKAAVTAPRVVLKINQSQQRTVLIIARTVLKFFNDGTENPNTGAGNRALTNRSAPSAVRISEPVVAPKTYHATHTHAHTHASHTHTHSRPASGVDCPPPPDGVLCAGAGPSTGAALRRRRRGSPRTATRSSSFG
jgi:hypothetical protein